jgi:predicted transcriptional regulator
MELKRAGDIMIPLGMFPYIPYWFTLRQAMAEMDRAEADKTKPKHVPWIILVFTAQNELIGMVRRREILRGLRPDILGGQPNALEEKLFDVKMDPNLIEMSFSYEKALIRLRKQIERPISDFMTPIEATVNYEDGVLRAIYQMVDKNLSFVPVVQEDHIVGVVYAVDALKEITKLLI